ncbi:MAG: hypothetical protein RL757_271 [Bacteroidota bacterium]|jgi:hypothetical protein
MLLILKKNLKKTTEISKRFFALAMALLMLVATSGINLERLYCLCKKQFSYSFFGEFEKACCSQKNVCAKPQHGCMQHSHQYFKLKIDVEKANTNDFSIQKYFSQISFSADFPKNLAWQRDISHHFEVLSQVASRPPPPPQYRRPSGREIGIFHQVFRC